MNSQSPPRGMALVEAMVASAVLAAGMLGAVRLSLHAQASARETGALAQAQTLAGEALDCALAAQRPCPTTLDTTLAGIRYTVTLERTVLPPQLQGLQVTVQWRADGNESSTPRRLSWQTRVSALSDGNSNALGVSSP